MSSCIFCDIVEKKLPAHTVYEDAHYIAFLDIRPTSPGHTVLIPKKHAVDILHDTPQTQKELLVIAAKLAPAIMKGMGASAFNLRMNVGGDAGQIIFHTHLHIIPRKKGESLWTENAMPHATKELDQVARKIRQANE